MVSYAPSADMRRRVGETSRTQHMGPRWVTAGDYFPKAWDVRVIDPTGPGNNLAGVKTTTSTTAPTSLAAPTSLPPVAPAALGRARQRDLTISTLLGRAAQAIQPEGIGARLGALGEQLATQTRFENALARSLAGEELSQAELQGLSPESVNQIMTLSEQAERRRGARQERESKAALDKVDQATRAAQLAAQLSELGADDARVQRILLDLGLSLGETDIRSPTERAIQRDIAGSGLRIEELQQRTAEELKLLARRHENALELAEVRSQADLDNLRARVGEDPTKLARYNAALQTVRSVADETTLPEERAIMFEDALRAWGLQDMVETMQGELFRNYLDGVDVPEPEAGTEGGISVQEATRLYGPPRAGNPYNLNNPTQRIGYQLYQEGMEVEDIAPLLVRISARKRTGQAAVSESTQAR